MDPSSLIHESSLPLSNAATSAYHLTDIWQFPIDNGGVSDSGGVIGIHSGQRRANFGELLGFAETTTRTNRDASAEESTVTEHSGGRKRKESASEDESSKLVSTSSGNEMNDFKGKRLKVGGSRDGNSESEVGVEDSSGNGNGNKPSEQSAQPSEAPKPDFIHVRARRGQATDSHSLAERARREKISERMKILQDLVPGCSKVIGKALVLDEIINYIQSLQNQVEFLSMKLEAVNSRMNPNIEGFMAKDFGMQAFDTSGMAFGSQATREYGQEPQPEWLHMQVGGGFDGAT